MTAFRKYNTRSAKLTRAEVFEIRRLYFEERWSQGKLARKYNMSSVQIGRIVRNESHRDVPTVSSIDPSAVELESAQEVPMPSDLLEKLLLDAAKKADTDSGFEQKVDPMDLLMNRTKPTKE